MTRWYIPSYSIISYYWITARPHPHTHPRPGCSYLSWVSVLLQILRTVLYILLRPMMSHAQYEAKASFANLDLMLSPLITYHPVNQATPPLPVICSPIYRLSVRVMFINPIQSRTYTPEEEQDSTHHVPWAGQALRTPVILLLLIIYPVTGTILRYNSMSGQWGRDEVAEGL